MKKSVYVLGFIALFTLSTAALFEIMNWPYAGWIIFIGYLLFNFGFLPTLFYKLYKRLSAHFLGQDSRWCGFLGLGSQPRRAFFKVSLLLYYHYHYKYIYILYILSLISSAPAINHGVGGEILVVNQSSNVEVPYRASVVVYMRSLLGWLRLGRLKIH